MVIWKFELKLTDCQFVMMPEGAIVLSVANQRGNLWMWAMVDDTRKHVKRLFEVIGTGNPIPSGERHFIGTAVLEPFVWHVFERKY